MTFSIVPLDSAKHDRNAFDCGVEPLNRYLARQAKQDKRRQVSACFVAIDDESGKVAGYYTLCATSIPLTDVSDDFKAKLPRYALIPAALIGRLAVDQNFRGQGLGGALLYDAFERTIKSDVMAFAMLVDAKDEAAIAFYQHHGFLTFESKPDSLYLPVLVAQKALP